MRQVFYNTPTQLPNSTKRVSASDPKDDVNLNRNWQDFISKDYRTKTIKDRFSIISSVSLSSFPSGGCLLLSECVFVGSNLLTSK